MLKMKFQTLVDGAKKSVIAPAVLLVASSTAMAEPVDYSAITDAVDWSSVTTGIISVLALTAAVIVAFTGGKMLIASIRGSK